MMRRLLVVCLLALAASVVEADRHVPTAGGAYSFDVIGASGQISLTPNNSHSFLKLKWDQLEEVDSTGASLTPPRTFTKFDHEEWLINGPVQVQYQGYNATQVTLTKTFTLDPSAGVTELKVVCYAFETTVTFDVANSTITVPKDNIKFNIEMRNWPFLSSDNQLTFGVDVLVPGSASGRKDTTSGSSKASNSSKNVDRWVFGVGSIEVATSAVINSVQIKAVKTDLYERGSHTGLKWTFPNFQTIVYDPTIGVDSGASIISAPFLTLIVVLIALVQFSVTRF